MPDAIADDFAAELRAARARRNLTQLQLAKMVGVATNTISRLECAERDVTLGLLIRIANAVGIPASELVDRVDSSRAERAGGAA